MRKKLCFIAQFPPPIHGLSKAVETLYNSDIEEEFDLEKIDITDNKKFLENVKAIARSGADLFYLTVSQSRGGNLRDLMILKMLRLKHKKCLIHLHGGYYKQLVDFDLPAWQRKANYKEISKLEGAIVLGPSLRYSFEGLLPNEKIYTVPNCIDDTYLISDEEFERKINSIPERKIKQVLYLSNFIKSKGYPEVLEMARHEKERVESGQKKKFHFNFAGGFFEKAEEDYFWNYVREYNIADFITYHGVVSGDSKKELLKLCDVFVLLTRYPKEGQPISILEAMGNGMVVITTDHAGIPDLLSSGQGIVVSKSAIRDAWDSLSSLSEQNYVSYGKAARKTVVNYYREDQYVERMKTIFRNSL